MNSLSLEQLVEQGIALQRANALDAAHEVFKSVLSLDQSNPVAHYSLGAIEFAQGHHQKALAHLEQVRTSHPKFAPAHLAESLVLFDLGELHSSAEAIETALALDPNLESAKEHQLAVKLALEGRQRPSMTGNDWPVPQSLTNPLLMEGVQLQGQDDHQNAVSLFQRVLADDPRNFPALYSAGLSLSRLGQLENALDHFTRAVDVQPDAAVAHYAVAKVLHDLGMVEDSLSAYDRAIQIDAEYMEAYNGKAALLQSTNRHHDALLTLVKASEVNPRHARSLEGQGLLLSQFKQYEWATQAFRQAMTADPDYPYIDGNIMSARLHNCDWTDFYSAREKIFDGVRSGKRMCSPHTIMSLTDDASLARRCIEIYASDKYSTSMYRLWNGERYQHRRKRVAFISADFRTHPVGYLLIGLMEKIDRRYLEITGVSTGTNDGSELWHRYRCVFDNYIDAQSKPSLEIAQLLRAMEMDIIVDLSGYTEGSRLDILSHRPAPNQMTYLGFPGTLGLPYIDYLITDRVTVPEESKQFYSEKILYLPHCYLPRDTSILPASRTPNRADFGLPENAFVFCSFNHDYKINPDIFKVWMDLLNAVPGSILWLMKLNATAHANLTESARKFGIDSSRIVFATRVPSVEEHLARYRLADLFLDTYPYNGHTTVGDALLAGLPTVTMAGQSYASRVALSLFNDLDIKTGFAHSFQEYFEISLAYARNTQARLEVRDFLLSRVESKSWPVRNEDQARALSELLLGI